MPGNRMTGRGCRMAIARRGFYPRMRGGSMRRGRIGWRVSGFEGGEEMERITVGGLGRYRGISLSAQLVFRLWRKKMLFIMYLLTLCIYALSYFCGVHNVSSHCRFTCPMCTPRTRSPPHTYRFSNFTVFDHAQIGT